MFTEGRDFVITQGESHNHESYAIDCTYNSPINDKAIKSTLQTYKWIKRIITSYTMQDDVRFIYYNMKTFTLVTMTV